MINEPNGEIGEIAGAFDKDQTQRWRKRDGVANRKTIKPPWTWIRGSQSEGKQPSAQVKMVWTVGVPGVEGRGRGLSENKWVLNVYTRVLVGVVQGEIWA